MSTHEELRAAQQVAAATVNNHLWLKLGANPDHAVTLVLKAIDGAVAALLDAGYRLVSVDPATVERVAKAMARDEVIRVTGVTWPGFTFAAHWIDFLSDDEREGYRAKARAAIAALKENQ